MEQGAQRQQGVEAQARLGSVSHLAPREGIKHPRGNGNLSAIGQCDEDTVRGLTAPPSDSLDGLSTAGMVRVTDRHYRRMMSSV